MTPIEKAQMWHLLRRWHARADELLRDERANCGWFLLDLADVYVAQTGYRPDGRRRTLDA